MSSDDEPVNQTKKRQEEESEESGEEQAEKLEQTKTKADQLQSAQKKKNTTRSPPNPVRTNTAKDPKAEDLITQAERKVNGGFFSKWLSGSSRFEEAAEMYTKAANIYKMQKNWEASAEAFFKAAGLHCQSESGHEAANCYVHAANCYKKTSSRDAIRCFMSAIDMYSDAGRFSLAAKYQKEVAEIFEKDGDLENAMINFERAAELHEGENAKSAAKPCLLKVASFAAELEDYHRAVEIFEQLAEENQEGLGKWSIKDYLLKAGLCKLASGDLVAVRQAIEKYKDTYNSFSRDRECKLLEDLVNACENYDAESFTDIVFQYDSLTTLDQWKTNILLKIKKSIHGEFGDTKAELLV